MSGFCLAKSGGKIECFHRDCELIGSTGMQDIDAEDSDRHASLLVTYNTMTGMIVHRQLTEPYGSFDGVIWYNQNNTSQQGDECATVIFYRYSRTCMGTIAGGSLPPDQLHKDNTANGSMIRYRNPNTGGLGYGYGEKERMVSKQKEFTIQFCQLCIDAESREISLEGLSDACKLYSLIGTPRILHDTWKQLFPTVPFSTISLRAFRGSDDEAKYRQRLETAPSRLFVRNPSYLSLSGGMLVPRNTKFSDTPDPALLMHLLSNGVHIGDAIGKNDHFTHGQIANANAELARGWMKRMRGIRAAVTTLLNKFHIDMKYIHMLVFLGPKVACVMNANGTDVFATTESAKHRPFSTPSRIPSMRITVYGAIQRKIHEHGLVVISEEGESNRHLVKGALDVFSNPETRGPHHVRIYSIKVMIPESARRNIIVL